MNKQATWLVSGQAFEKFVHEVFPNRIWKFPFQSSPVFVPSATVKPCCICEDVIETWASGINGRHYHVSASVLVRHFTHKGLIPPGTYLLLSNLKMYGERVPAGLSDESTYKGNTKGVF